MKVERHVGKGVIWFVFAGMMICSVSLMYFGTIHRFSYASKYENYSEVAGRLNSLQEYENEDSDSEGNTYYYYTYAAEIEYIVDGTKYVKVTSDIFSKDNVPEVGRKVPILYNNDNPNDCVVAKEDWMTRSLIPFTDKGDNWLYSSLLCLAFALIVAAMALDNAQVKGIVLGSGLLLVGIDGLVMGLIMSNYQMFFLLIFGVAGAVVLFRYLFIPKEVRQRQEAVPESLRMIKVHDIYVAPQTGLKTVVFAVMENNGNTVQMLSYDDHNHRFHSGDIYQISKDEVIGCHEERLVNGYNTIDISGLGEKAIQQMNPRLKKTPSYL